MSNCIPRIEYEHPVDGTTTIQFVMPQSGDPIKEKNRTSGKETRSNGGKTQYQLNYDDTNFSYDFVFLDFDLLEEVRKFWNDYAKQGRPFKLFQHSDEVEFFNCLLPGNSKSFNPQRVIRSGDDFIYDLKLQIRVIK